MKIPVALLLLCNIILILPCFCENNHNITDKIDIKNVTITNSFAFDLKKNYTSNILTKLLAEAGNTTSKQSGSKPRKKAELIEPPITSNINTTIAKNSHEIIKNLNNTNPRPIISQNNSKNISQILPVTTSNDFNNKKNLTDSNKYNTNSDKNKLLDTNTTINTNKNSTKTNSLQTIKLEGGSEIAINSVNKSQNSKINNSIKSTTISSKINPEKLKVTTTTNTNNNNSSKVKVNNNLTNLNSTNSNKINATNTTNTAKIISTTTTTTNTTTSTTSSTTTTTTTTPKPKKPKITFSEEDVPAIGLYAKKLEQSEHNKLPSSSVVEEPLVQPVKEDLHGNHRDYILPIVAFIFAVPILMGAAIISYRRIKDYWSTRHYRRMDFLVDGMYNE